jgi:phasin family protein
MTMARAKTLQSAAESVTETMTEALSVTSGQFEDMQARMIKAFDSANDIAKANIEAMNAATAAATKGFDTMTKAYVGFAKGATEAAQTTLASLRTAKTAQELMDLQQSRARAHYDHFIAETSRLTELYVKVAGDVMQPISTRYAVAMDEVTKVAA